VDTFRQLLEHSPLLALFAAIGIGYAIGRISVAGFSLDIGAVLFAGLALGAIAPKAAPPGLVGSIGLVMFLYGIGIQYGRQFFAGLAGPGLLWNAIGAIGVVVALGVTIGAVKVFGVPVPQALGLFAGSLTSTPTLQAAIEAAGNRDPALGYSLAYPMGVIGPIINELFPTSVRATALGIIYNVSRGVQAIAPVAFCMSHDQQVLSGCHYKVTLRRSSQ